MADLFDYLRWRGDLSFSQAPLNAVDGLIFSALSYLSFSGSVAERQEIPITLAEASEEFLKLTDAEDRCRAKTDLSLLMAAAETRRFGSSMLLQYRNILIPEEDTQFAAVTFLLDNNSAFIAFRGTDFSLVGWKEDFNMTFQETIPAQRLALQYATEIGEKYVMPLYLGGHSKGGNLAVFSAVKVSPEIRSRIRDVYNHDGPGFTDFVMQDPAYKEMAPKIHTIIPQSSVIGMLLEHEEPYTIIKSKQIGLLQHDFYTWELSGPNFVPMEEITSDSRFLNLTFKKWLADMSTEDRNEVVDAVFDFLSIGDVSTVQEIIQPRNLRNYFRAFSSDSKIRQLLSEEFANLIEAAKQTQQELEAAANENRKLPE